MSADAPVMLERIALIYKRKKFPIIMNYSASLSALSGNNLQFMEGSIVCFKDS